MHANLDKKDGDLEACQHITLAASLKKIIENTYKKGKRNLRTEF